MYSMRSLTGPLIKMQRVFLRSSLSQMDYPDCRKICLASSIRRTRTTSKFLSRSVVHSQALNFDRAKEEDRGIDVEDESMGSDKVSADMDELWKSALVERTGKEIGGENEASTSQSESKFCVVNFYHLKDIAQPHQVIRNHRAWLDGKNILGRIYISHQGINAQYSGPMQEAHDFAIWVAQSEEFTGLRWASDPVKDHQFPRLRLKYRENLVQLAGGTTRLPLSDPMARAKPLEPSHWKKMLQESVSMDSASSTEEIEEKRPIILDVRNSYEWDGGHFEGSQRPSETQFNQTPTDSIPEPLNNISKDTPIMMYCTGGIRCDIYSPLLREKGFTNLYTLHGGVANYLREIGSENWKGSLFTFDNRLAIAPDGGTLSEKSLKAASPCQCCGGEAQLPHLNCANIDCNKLFLACSGCQGNLKGCCSSACLEAPRMLRPSSETNVFGRWHTLVKDQDKYTMTDAIRSGRSPIRIAKRKRRVERLKEKYEELRKQKAERKAMINAAMEKLKAVEIEAKEEQREILCS